MTLRCPVFVDFHLMKVISKREDVTYGLVVDGQRF